MTPNRDETDNLKRSVAKLNSALNGLEDAKATALASEQFVSAIKILELSTRFRMRREEATKRGQRELERLYRECEEIIATSDPSQVVDDLARIKNKFQSAMEFFAKLKGSSDFEELQQTIGRC